MSPRNSDSHDPALREATSTLKGALDDACASNVDDADTGELIRIEEMLAIANDAAKHAVSVRRRNSQRPTRTSSGHREVEDPRGIRWAVFAIHPSAGKASSALNERFRNGWLAFDSGVETRRVAPIPENWETMSDSELAGVCERAEVALRRRP
jgi:hypothetical protein